MNAGQFLPFPRGTAKGQALLRWDRLVRLLALATAKAAA
jgi:hypothetical protein